MKRLTGLLAVILLTLCLPIMTRADSAKDSVRALMKLETKVDTGINRRDYSNELAECKFEARLYKQSEEAKKCPKLTESINRVLEHYENANELMNACTGRCIRIHANDPLGQRLLALYPEARGSHIYHTQDYKEFGGVIPFLSFEPMLILIWSKASLELQNTMKLLASCE